MPRDPDKPRRWRLYRRHLHRLCPEFREEVRRYWRRYVEVYVPPLEIHQTSDEWPERRPWLTLFQEVKDLRREIVTRWPEAPDDAFKVKPLQSDEWDAIPLSWVLHQARDEDPAPPELAFRLSDPEYRDLWELMPELLPAWRKQEAARMREVRARLALAPPPGGSRNRKRNERLVIQWPGLPADSVEARRLNALALAEADTHGLGDRPFTALTIAYLLWPDDPTWEEIANRTSDPADAVSVEAGPRGGWWWDEDMKKLRTRLENRVRDLADTASQHRETLPLT